MIEPTAEDIGAGSSTTHRAVNRSEMWSLRSIAHSRSCGYDEVSSKATRREDLTWARPGD